jgi:diacylglycerol kinase (ATP)
VPQLTPTHSQRSHSFDSASTSTTVIGGDDANTFLEVPRRFQRRKSSTKSPPFCVHCQYVQEQRKRSGSAGFYFDAQEFRALTYSDTSSSDSDEEENQAEKDSEDYNNVNYFVHNNILLPPPSIASPCGITFTLSPTICDYPAFPAPGIVPGSPPILPSSPPPIFPNLINSPTIEFPPNELDQEQHEHDETMPPTARQRRRSISRQEAIFVEPTGNSLENVSNASDIDKQLEDTDATEAITVKVKTSTNKGKEESQDDPFVRDIFLTVPDLKRDRAASVDSCFTKVSSSAKTEELQPPEGEMNLNLLAVPSGALRSRSVDIVLPTEEQARYKALALAGPGNNSHLKGYVFAFLM